MVYRLPKWRIWKALAGNGPRLHRKFLKAAYLVHFYLFSLLKRYCVCMRRRIWV